MALLNYSTSVAADKTAGQIQAMLAKAGARHIMSEYDARGRPIGLSFTVEGPLGRRSYALPINREAVHRVISQRNSGVPQRFRTLDQAERIAWRILKDWVEAQLALIETTMVDLGQVMLPYMHTDGTGSVTVYDLYLANARAEIGPGS